jgi:hypothetical protein
MGSLGGRCARCNVPFGEARNEGVALRLRPRPRGNQNGCTVACHRWLDGLMAHMADWAGAGGKVGVIMPDLSDRRPYHEREKRYRQHEVPNPLLAGHF